MTEMSREQLDVELLKFLRSFQEDGDGLKDAMQRLSNELLLLRTQLESSDALHKERWAGHESRIQRLESNAEDTGQHNVEDLRMKLREMRDEKNNTLKMIIGAIGSALVLFAGAAGSVIWYLITRNNK